MLEDQVASWVKGPLPTRTASRPLLETTFAWMVDELDLASAKKMA